MKAKPDNKQKIAVHPFQILQICTNLSHIERILLGPITWASEIMDIYKTNSERYTTPKVYAKQEIVKGIGEKNVWKKK